MGIRMLFWPEAVVMALLLNFAIERVMQRENDNGEK